MGSKSRRDRGHLGIFGVKEKVVAITVDYAANMDVGVRRISVRKISCFAYTLNIAAQKIYTIPSITRWAL